MSAYMGGTCVLSRAGDVQEEHYQHYASVMDTQP